MLKTAFENLRSRSPLIHNITNYVTVNDCANMVLACGASPIMADDAAEVEEITAICGGLNINIGTLNSRTVTSMLLAGKKANQLGHPVVLDPVGAGASRLRTDTAFRLLREVQFTVIRGNISEIKTLASGAGTTKGVDADVADKVTEENLDSAVAFAKAFAARTGAVVAITGAIDIVADAQKAYCIRNGNAMMSSITGTGCQLSGLTAAFVTAQGRVPYQDVSGHDFTALLLGNDSSRTYEYVMVPNTGDTADYQGLDVTGKIAVVMRGGLSFEQKQLNAASAGAAGCIIYNNRDGYLLNMAVDNYKIPTVCISLANGQMMEAAQEKTLTVSKTEKGSVAMSDFSSWGPLPSLSLKPEITAPGAGIYAAVPGGYESMDGTSMASPHAAGGMAIVQQALKARDNSMTAHTFGANGLWSVSDNGTLSYQWMFRNSKSARHLLLSGDNQIAAKKRGINTNRLRVGVMAMSGLMCGIGAALTLSNLTSADTTTGSDYAMSVIGAVVIGGTKMGGGAGSMWGSLIGIALVTVIQNGLVFLGLQSGWRSLFIGVTMLIAIAIDTVVEKRALRRRGKQ